VQVGALVCRGAAAHRRAHNPSVEIRVVQVRVPATGPALGRAAARPGTCAARHGYVRPRHITPERAICAFAAGRAGRRTVPGLREGSAAEAGLSAARLDRLRDLTAGWVKDGTHPAIMAVVARRGVIAFDEVIGRLGPEPDAMELNRDALFPLA